MFLARPKVGLIIIDCISWSLHFPILCYIKRACIYVPFLLGVSVALEKRKEKLEQVAKESAPCKMWSINSQCPWRNHLYLQVPT